MSHDTYTLPDGFFRTLDPVEEMRFRQWARENYRPGDAVSPLWHPIIRSEAARMDREEFRAFLSHSGTEGGAL